MSFDKAIEHKKTRRKQWKKSKRVDPSCRNHGGCPWCKGNRLHNTKMKEEKAKEDLKEANYEYSLNIKTKWRILNKEEANKYGIGLLETEDGDGILVINVEDIPKGMVINQLLDILEKNGIILMKHV